MLFAAKILISSCLIAYSSWLAGKKPGLAGFIIALPLATLLGIIFTYSEYRSMDKVNDYAVSILTAVPLSLLFFIPFVLNRWLKMNFPATLIFALVLLTLAYFVHASIFKNT